MAKRAKQGVALALAAAFVLLFWACGTGERQSLRLLCTQVNRDAADTLPKLKAEQFALLPGEEEARAALVFESYWGDGLLLTVQTLPDGRVTAVSLTGLPGDKNFFAAALCLARVFVGAEADAAERLLGQLQAGRVEVLGVNTAESGGCQIAVAANAAGLYFCAARTKGLPPRAELPTLREQITEE